MMYEQQQQQVMKMDSRKRERSIEEQRLEMVDLSGMSLETLPNPSLNLAAICKLDLSNNNIQVLCIFMTSGFGFLFGLW